MRYELTHDSLARLVYQKASKEAQNRRKVEKFIEDRYRAHLERKAKLTQEDLDYIQPYLAEVNISPEAIGFVEKAREALLRKRRRRRMLVGTVIAILTSSLVIAIAQRNIATRALKDLRVLSQGHLNEVPAQIRALKYQTANHSLELALELGMEEQQVQKGILELIFVYTEAGKYTAAMVLVDNLRSYSSLSFPSLTHKDTLTFLSQTLTQCSDSLFLHSLQQRYYPSFILVSEGPFEMGKKEGRDEYLISNSDETPLHTVVVEEFLMSQTEVTVWQYYLYTLATDSIMAQAPDWGYLGDHPVVKVTWDEATAYAQWLSQVKQKRISLPTEAQWEYAARGGQKSKKFLFAGSNLSDSVAWYDQNASAQTAPVMSKAPNELLLYDMSGNVWEWCQDWYGPTYYGSLPELSFSPGGPEDSPVKARVIRGGAYSFSEEHLRLSNRHGGLPEEGYSQIGFRVVDALDAGILDALDALDAGCWMLDALDALDAGCWMLDWMLDALDALDAR